MPIAPNLVTNGGFETGNFDGWSVTDPEPQNPDIGIDTQPLDVNSGSFGLFAGNETSTLSQTIATTAGHTYTVSFFLDVYQSTAYEGGLTATFGGQTAVNLSEPAETDQFVQYTAQITATSANSTLQFSFTDPGGFFGLDDVSVTDNAACYVSGTRILTPNGEVCVERLAIGDLVVTLSGAAEPIRWIGRRRVNILRHPQPETVRPVRTEAGALGEGQPLRDLWLSPEHALWLDGALVPVGSLINGATIRQEAWTFVNYFHVELDAHEILIAEGAAAESYLDCGNRDNFENATDGIVKLHAEGIAGAASRALPSPARVERLREGFAQRSCERGRAREVAAFAAAQRVRAQVARTNVLRNPRGEGSAFGILGAGGRAPAHWRFDAPAGVSIALMARGAHDFLPFVDLRIFGRTAATANLGIYPDIGPGVAARRGEDWTMSVYVRLVGGALRGVDRLYLYVDENAAGGAYLTGAPYLQFWPTPDALVLQRMSATRRMVRADVATTMGYLQIELAAGAAIDVTLRLAGMQFEKGAYASDLILPPRGELRPASRGGLAAPEAQRVA